MRIGRRSHHPILVWAGLFLLTVATTLQVHADYLHADGMFYFVQLRSLYFDRDVDFRNEAGGYPWIRASYGTPLPNQLLANPFPVGSAVLWSPFYAIADGVCHLERSGTCRGYSRVYIRAVVVGTVFWATLGCMLNVGTIKRLGGQPHLAWLATLTMAVASPLIFYVLLQADYSHGASYFTSSLLLYTTIRARGNQFSLRTFFVCGLAVGLAFLVRWQDLALGLLPLACAVSRGSLRTKLSKVGVLVCGTLVSASPQFVFWAALYGRPFTVPQGAGFLSVSHLSLLPFLFSTWNGVFLWHPILLAALAGLCVLPRKFFDQSTDRLRMLRWSCIAAIAVEMLVSMLVEDWWSGGAFGQRRLISVLPLLTLGFYHLLVLSMERGRKTAAALGGVVVTLAVWNALTMFRYYEGKLPFNPVHSSSYASGVPYGQYDYLRRFSDILMGRQP